MAKPEQTFAFKVRFPPLTIGEFNVLFSCVVFVLAMLDDKPEQAKAALKAGEALRELGVEDTQRLIKTMCEMGRAILEVSSTGGVPHDSDSESEQDSKG